MRSLIAVAVLMLSTPVLADEATPEASPAATPEKKKDDASKEAKPIVRCEPHGVNKSLCTRCNPKLAPVFKAKGDWCGEHDRPESQCAICKPDLKKEGIKP